MANAKFGPHIGIVGSGPTATWTADEVLRRDASARVTIISPTRTFPGPGGGRFNQGVLHAGLEQGESVARHAYYYLISAQTEDAAKTASEVLSDGAARWNRDIVLPAGAQLHSFAPSVCAATSCEVAHSIEARLKATGAKVELIKPRKLLSGARDFPAFFTTHDKAFAPYRAYAFHKEKLLKQGLEVLSGVHVTHAYECGTLRLELSDEGKISGGAVLETIRGSNSLDVPSTAKFDAIILAAGTGLKKIRGSWNQRGIVVKNYVALKAILDGDYRPYDCGVLYTSPGAGYGVAPHNDFAPLFVAGNEAADESPTTSFALSCVTALADLPRRQRLHYVKLQEQILRETVQNMLGSQVNCETLLEMVKCGKTTVVDPLLDAGRSTDACQAFHAARNVVVANAGKASSAPMTAAHAVGILFDGVLAKRWVPPTALPVSANGSKPYKTEPPFVLRGKPIRRYNPACAIDIGDLDAMPTVNGLVA